MKLMAKMGAAATMGAPMPATNQHEGGAAEGSVECDGWLVAICGASGA